MDPVQVSVIQVTPLRQNCAVVFDPGTRRGIVTDPGGDVARIQAEIVARDLQIEAILLTHGHADHVAGAEGLREALGSAQARPVPIFGPGEADAFLLAEAGQRAAEFGIPDGRPVVPDRMLVDGDVLEFLGRRIEVRHVPGHSPGHMVFVLAEDRVAIVGDTLFRGVVGRTDFTYGDHAALIAGIRDKLMTLPDDVSVLPGHGMPTTIGAERRGNPYLNQKG